MARKSTAEERRYTALLVTSHDVRARGLRTMLEEEPLLRLVDEAEVPGLSRAASRLKPDAVIEVGDLNQDVILHVAQEVREAVPESRLIVICETVDYDLEIALARLNAAGFVLWKDLNPRSLRWLLGSVLEGGWRVGSPQAVEEITLPPERRRRARDESLQFTEQERVILRGLAQGLSDEELARLIDRSVRTVERIRERLEVKLHARNRAQLAARAAERGFGAE